MGTTLAAIHDELVHRSVVVGKAYPKNSRAVRKLAHAAEFLLLARGALDDVMANEHPEEFRPTVYFPSREDRAQIALHHTTEETND
ncbi:hypothetical protein [Streptomyces sp. NPDC004008]